MKTRTNCYHCDEKPHRKGSIFCEDCNPAPGTLPAIVQEPIDRPEGRRGFREWISRMLAPWRHVATLSHRCNRLAAELADYTTANLALRRKCDDLRSQRDALRIVHDEDSAKLTRMELEHKQASHELSEAAKENAKLLKACQDETAAHIITNVLKDELQKQFDEARRLLSTRVEASRLDQITLDYKNLLATYQHEKAAADQTRLNYAQSLATSNEMIADLQKRLEIQIELGGELAVKKDEWKARAESAEAQLADLRAQYQEDQEGATE